MLMVVDWMLFPYMHKLDCKSLLRDHWDNYCKIEDDMMQRNSLDLDHYPVHDHQYCCLNRLVSLNQLKLHASLIVMEENWNLVRVGKNHFYKNDEGHRCI